MKHELLVPAGNMECLLQAIFNGADAIYLGCKAFGARKFAANFSNDEIVLAIKKAHLYGVKIYVTMNTLVLDSEVDDFLEQVSFLHKNGVDAILIQDFGMMSLVREMFPDLEVHASTQANTSSKETAQLYHDMGIKRVVFSREMSLDEIEEIDVPIEKEVFIHGALCISYSGCCLMSSMLGTRSGNRGECAGSCRLPYSLSIDGNIISTKKYLLSTRELNSSKNFADLLNSSITSFKVEGRMKSPEYVGFITSYYRHLIDGDSINLEEETNKLKTIFNREFTSGHLFNSKISKFMNNNRPNHIGLPIGEVISVTKDKIKIKLNRTINQNDGIRFLNSNKGFIVNFLYDSKDRLVSSADGICFVDNKVGLTEKDKVMKTLDYNLMNDLKKLPDRRIGIDIFVSAFIGSNLEIKITDGENSISTSGSIVEEASKAPLTKERIQEQLSKLGNTPFKCNNFNIKCSDNIFISIKELNELRRELCDELINLRENKNINFSKNEVKFDKYNYSEEVGYTGSVYNEEQLLQCLELNFKRIYVNDLELYEKYKDNNKIYYKVPRCIRKPGCYFKERNLISDYYSCDDIKIGDYTLNVSNIYTIYYLQKLGFNNINLSVELDDFTINEIIRNYKIKFGSYPSIEVLVYGRVENMIIKDNILNIEENSKNVRLIDFKNREFPVIWDLNNTHILNHENYFRNELKNESHISSYRFDFYDESKDDIVNIIRKWENN